MVEFAIDGVFFHIRQRVVHPSHVPLKPKTQPTGTDRPCHAGKGRRFFSNRHNSRHLPIADGVGALQRGNHLVILTPAVFIGNPLAGGAAKISVQHRGHGIDPHAINVVFFQPIQRIRDQVIRHLDPAIIIDQRVPIRMEPLPGIFVFIKCGAVKITQAMGITGKMPRHPINQDPDAL